MEAFLSLQGLFHSAGLYKRNELWKISICPFQRNPHSFLSLLEQQQKNIKRHRGARCSVDSSHHICRDPDISIFFQNVGFAGMFDVLSSKPVLNKETTMNELGPRVLSQAWMRHPRVLMEGEPWKTIHQQLSPQKMCEKGHGHVFRGTKCHR